MVHGQKKRFYQMNFFKLEKGTQDCIYGQDVRGCDEQKLASSNDLGSLKRSFLNYYNYASFFFNS